MQKTIFFIIILLATFILTNSPDTYYPSYNSERKYRPGTIPQKACTKTCFCGKNIIVDFPLSWASADTYQQVCRNLPTSDCNCELFERVCQNSNAWPSTLRKEIKSQLIKKCRTDLREIRRLCIQQCSTSTLENEDE
jgi:hypothetical protein